MTTIKCIVYLCLNIFFSTYYSQPCFRLKYLDNLMHYMVPFFFYIYTHNFVIEEVLHHNKELCKFSHKCIKNTLHSFSYGSINFCECPTRGIMWVIGLMLPQINAKILASIVFSLLFCLCCSFANNAMAVTGLFGAYPHTSPKAKVRSCTCILMGWAP